MKNYLHKINYLLLSTSILLIVFLPLLIFWNNNPTKIPNNDFVVSAQSINPNLNKEEIILDIDNTTHVFKKRDFTYLDSSGIEKYDINFLIKYFPKNISNDSFLSANIVGEMVVNCNSEKIFGEIDLNLLEKDIIEAFRLNKKELKIDFSKYINKNFYKITDLCLDYNKKFDIIKTAFKRLLVNDLPEISTFIGMDVNGNLKIINDAKFLDVLQEHYTKSYVEFSSGEYSIVNNTIHIHKHGETEVIMKFLESKEQILNWLNNPTNFLPILYTNRNPEYLSLNYPILDFSKTISKGYTRLEITKNGTYNYGLDNAINGLIELNGTIVQPNEEFSYIKMLDPQPNGFLTKEGRFIGSGICNATTTLFRAVLEGGFQITERNFHAYNYDSYDWSGEHKFPYNIVDASYYTNPEIDLKFINNYKYPIQIQFEKHSEGNYSYHTITIKSDIRVVDRDVNLYDFKKFNIYSPKSFEASFNRRVEENGVKIIEDSFYSMYR